MNKKAFFSFSAVAVLLASSVAFVAHAERATIDVNSQESVSAAQFAVTELRKLSDSGVYESLKLNKIVKAEAEEGVYHFNIFLTLELSSDHFKSGKSSESFGIIVLRSNEDGVLSFAIDDFPEMTEASIEQFWINMVEEHRRKRNLKFLELEEKGLLEDALSDATKSQVSAESVSVAAERAKVAGMDTDALSQLESKAATPAYQKHLIAEELDKRWAAFYRERQAVYDSQHAHSEL